MCMCVCWCMYARMLSHLSHVWLFVTLWTVAHQAPLSMGFSRQNYWSELPCPRQGIFLTQVSNLLSYVSYTVKSYTVRATGKACVDVYCILKRWVLLWKGSKEFGVKSKFEFEFQPCHLLAVFSLVITYFY